MGVPVIIMGGYGGRVREDSRCQGREFMKGSPWRDSPRENFLSIHYVSKVRAAMKEAVNHLKTSGSVGEH